MIAPRSLTIQEILFATDFSPHSYLAFQAALALAEHFGARLHVLHVVNDESEQKAGLAKLKAFTEAEVEGTEIVKAIAKGHASSEIVAYASREKIDLIVMGTHGRTGLAHVLRGSVAEAVVRTAPCQVLTIKRGEEPRAATVPPAEGKAMTRSTEFRCLVCVGPSQELICETCKAKIRGEALERKSREERPGKKGLSV